MASEREQFPVVGALLNAADDAEARGYLESATALRLRARKMSDLFDDGSCVLFRQYCPCHICGAEPWTIHKSNCSASGWAPADARPVTRLAGGVSSLKAEVTPEATPALREALKQIQALTQRICERESAMGDRDLADLFAIRAHARAALRASEEQA